MPKLHFLRCIAAGWPTWTRYAATVVLVTGVLGLRLWFGAYLVGYPVLGFFAAVIVSAALFDRGCGLFAVLLSDLYIVWLVIPQQNSLADVPVSNVPGVTLFTVIGLGTALVIEALHRSLSALAEVNGRLRAANEQLAATESEKDLLLREAAHRMRNDLNMLIALVHLQQRAVQDETAQAILESTADRVQVLARVHDRLHRSEGESIVRTREFISDLCNDLSGAIRGLRPIALTVDAEQHDLPQGRAVAVGLIINELVTNALKYAFPDERAGTITVRFALEGDGFVLQVVDDGVGMAFQSPARSPGSGLGQRLIRSMAVQLAGALQVGPDSGAPGTETTVRFPVDG